KQPHRMLRWGIAPVTLMAEDFVTALSVLPEEHHCVTSCVDAYRSQAMSFAEKHKVPNVYTSFEDLARCPSVDVVYISPLNPMHCELCHLMLNHDKHVLCEQPLCMTEHQVREVVSKAQARGLFLMEGFWPRCLPAYELLRRELANANLGRIYQLTCTLGWPLLTEQDKQTYGGVVKDLGPYAIQLALWVYRDVPQLIKVSGKLNEDHIDILADIELHFKGNRTARLVLSAAEKLNNVVIMHGTSGNAMMSNSWCPDVMKFDKTDFQFVLPHTKRPTFYNNRIGVCYEAEEVRNCILGGRTESELFKHGESCLMANLTSQIQDMLGVNHGK
ncbi:hypothetical protein KR222_006402, partial [Zaprionus bogoriensis]